MKFLKICLTILIVSIISFFCNSCGGGEGLPGHSFTPVPSPSGKNITWTVLIYMNGNSNLENLTDLKMRDLASLGSSPQVNILVQQSKLSQEGRAKRYHIKGNGLNEEVSSLDITDMAAPSTLEDFIRWGRENFPADYYMLNIFTHGGGWKGLLRDDCSGHVMDISQLQKALSDQEIDIVSFNSCSMSAVEVAYQLRNCCDILVSSEEDVPVSGWPYELILGSLLEDSQKMPEEFSKTIVDDYINYYRSMQMTNMTLSAIDLNKMLPLGTSLKNFTDITINKPDTWQQIKNDRAVSLLFYDKKYVDISAFFKLIASSDIYPSNIRTEAEKVVQNLNDAIIISKKTEGSSTASGISLFFPDTSVNMIDYNNNKYSSLNFGNYNYNWENFLVKLYQ